MPSDPMSAEGLRRENAELQARLIAIDEAYRNLMAVARGNSFNILQYPDRYNAIVRTFYATMDRGGAMKSESMRRIPTEREKDQEFTIRRLRKELYGLRIQIQMLQANSVELPKNAGDDARTMAAMHGAINAFYGAPPKGKQHGGPFGMKAVRAVARACYLAGMSRAGGTLSR